jgi:hypothetical protein
MIGDQGVSSGSMSEMENLSLEEMANNDATTNPKNPA